MSRKEIQAIAKKLGIKANQSTSALINEISESRFKTDCIEQSRTLLSFNDGLEISESNEDATASTSYQCEKKNNEEFLFNVGDSIEALISGKHCTAVIKKVNKKTFRVKVMDGSDLESTILKTDAIKILDHCENQAAPTKLSTNENIESDKDLIVENIIDDELPPIQFNHSLDISIEESNPPIITTAPIVNTPSVLRVDEPPPPPHMAASPVLKRRSFCGRTPVNPPRGTKADTLRRESTLARSSVTTAVKLIPSASSSSSKPLQPVKLSSKAPTQRRTPLWAAPLRPSSHHSGPHSKPTSATLAKRPFTATTHGAMKVSLSGLLSREDGSKENTNNANRPLKVVAAEKRRVEKVVQFAGASQVKRAAQQQRLRLGAH